MDRARQWRWPAAAAGVLTASVGCGGSETVPNTAPLTDEQKAAIKAEDAAVEAAEIGTPTRPRAKR